MTNHDKIKQFFTNAVVKDCVSIRKVEELAEIPNRSLYSFLKGEKYRSLTNEQIQKLLPVLKEIGYK